MDLLEIQHLKKYFLAVKGYLRAVDDVPFIIEGGTMLGMVSESGCGKNTLGHLILRLLDLTEGKVYYKGDNILAYDKHKMRMICQKIQITFQDPYESLNPEASVEETILGALIVNKLYRPKTELDDKIYKSMGTVGLVECLINPYPHELDGGRRQRIGTARVLVLNPEFIVCDEPISVLDVFIQAQILNLIQSLQEQKEFTYIFITHNLSIVKHISDNIVVMYLGQVVELAPRRLLLSYPSHPYARALLAAVPAPKLSSRNKQGKIIYGEIISLINPGSECKSAKCCPFVKGIRFQTKPELVEIEPGHLVTCHEYP